MRRSIVAPILSAFVLPGLGQVLNRQAVKGFVLMGLTTVILLTLIVKLFLDLSAIMGEVIGADLNVGPHLWPAILEGLRNRDMTVLLILVLAGASIWGYGVFDAFIHGRKPFPDEDGENL